MKIMFICTDNFTRSVTAELCLRHYLNERGIQGIECASSGLRANSDVSGLFKEHFERMAELGIDISPFSRLQFREEFLSAYDVVVAIAKEHQEYIQDAYNQRIPLFNEIYKGEETAIVIQSVGEDAIRTELRDLVDYIYGAMPKFLEVLTK